VTPSRPLGPFWTLLAAVLIGLAVVMTPKQRPEDHWATVPDPVVLTLEEAFGAPSVPGSLPVVRPC
jgi:hypothetical protein